MEEPVKKYLPDFITANPEKGDKITVRMLLNNTSGLTGKTRNSFDMSEQSIEKMLGDLSNSFILTEPGTVYQYTNIGFSIAGLLIRKVSGKSYAEYVTEHIFKPLHMFNTSVLPLQTKHSARGHLPGIKQAIAAGDMGLMSGEFIPAGKFAQSTTGDLANFLMMYLNNGIHNNKQLVSPCLLAEMWKPEIDFIGLSIKEGGDGKKYQYGLGWMISHIDGRKVIHHGGSTGTASSFTMIDPKNDLAVSLLSNVDLTLIDRHHYAFGLSIVNNILHLAAGNTITDYAKPAGTDPTINNFRLPEELHANYAGHYQHKQGGDNFVYYDQPDVVITKQGADLKGTVLREGQVINEFLLDFVNPAIAVSRNIARPSHLRFQLDKYGKANRFFCFGMELRKATSHTVQLVLKKIEIGPLLYTIPEKWILRSTEKGFTLSHPEHHTMQIRCYRSDKPLENVNLGSQYVVRNNKIHWEKKSTILEEGSSKKLATSFSTQLEGQYYAVELISKPSEHSYAVQQVIKPFLEEVQINGKM